MKQVIKHACGHEESHDLSGGSQERENRLEWLKKNVCRHCYREEERQRQKDKAEEAVQACLRLGFPVLSGSEDEATNASIIRMRVYESACRTLPAKEHRNVRKIIAAERNAGWWTDHNKDPSRVVLNLIMARHPALERQLEKKKGGSK